MTPTRYGRSPTRLVLLGSLGLVVTFFFGLAYQDFVTPYVLIGYIAIIGLAWDRLYNLLQTLCWNRDWPPIFQLGEGIVEGAFLWGLTRLVPLPGIRPDLTLPHFLAHYTAIWLALFLAKQSLPHIDSSFWQLKGGQRLSLDNQSEPNLAPPVEPSPAVLQVGRYEVQAELGLRGNAMVYRAYDPELDRQVAIKLLQPEYNNAGADVRARFRQEIEVIAALDHKAIVEVYDYGEHEGRPFVVMPYLAGGTLETRLKEGPIELVQLAPMMSRIASALDQAHRRDIAHGQIYPGNILFDEQGQAYLSDFGIHALMDDQAAQNNQPVPAYLTNYLSPERARKLKEGLSSDPNDHDDLYALGVIIFEALTGHPPSQATTGDQATLAQLTESIPSLDDLNLNLPKGYQSIINRALARNPQDRYQRAQDLAHHLEDVAAGRWYLSELTPKFDSQASQESPWRNGEPAPSAVPTPASPAVFETTIGRYQVQQELGKGAMGVVYLAFDPHTRRQVAIKVLPHQFTEKAEFRDQFRREAELVANLKHEAIGSVYDFGEHEGQPYIVMQYLSGGTLAQKIAQKRLALGQLEPIFTRVAAALDEAHARQIIHQDVKPANILFNAAGDAFLSDFGIAVITRAGSKGKNYIGGTPVYVSPEQAQAILGNSPPALSPLSDIYSLGVILFEVLAGRPPFEGDTISQLLTAHVKAPIPQIQTKNADLPAGSQAIIERALAKDPTRRYQTAGELAAQVRDLATGRWLLHNLYRILSKP